MTYRELLGLYKQGKLEEEKCKEIEADIEKQDAISEYLYEEELMPEFDLGETNPETEIAELQTELKFAKMIQRSIRKAFIKLGATVSIIVLLIVLFVQLALPNVVSAFYYDPSKIVKGSTNQMSLDMAVYTELYMPGYHRTDVSVRKRGYGNYQIRVNQISSFTDKFTNVSGKIERNKLTYYNENILQLPTGNAFEWYYSGYDTTKSLRSQVEEPEIKKSKDGSEIEEIYRILAGAGGTTKDSRETIKELDDHKNYLAYVSLDQILSYKQFVDFMDQWDSFYEVWCAPIIETQENQGVRVTNIGFIYDQSSSSMSLKWDKKQYPYLQLRDEDTTRQEQDDSLYVLRSEKIARQHFISMLQYMDKQKRFHKMIDENYDEAEDYQGYVKYIEENGLQIYGFAVIAEKEELKKLIDSKKVYSIYVTNYE